MIPTEVTDQRWLEPGRIAEICSGRVLRRGQPAGRIVTDSRELRAGDCFVALRGEYFDGHDFLPQVFARGAAGAVVSRPISRAQLAAGAFVVRVEDTFAALVEMARQHRRDSGARVIGITGSCGKTSMEVV